MCASSPMKNACVRRWTARKNPRPAPTNIWSRRAALPPRAPTKPPAGQHWQRVRLESRVLHHHRLSASTTIQRTTQARRQRRRQDSRHSTASAFVMRDGASFQARWAPGSAGLSQRNRPLSCYSNSLLSGDKAKSQIQSNGDLVGGCSPGTGPNLEYSVIVGFLLFWCQYMMTAKQETRVLVKGNS